MMKRSVRLWIGGGLSSLVLVSGVSLAASGTQSRAPSRSSAASSALRGPVQPTLERQAVSVERRMEALRNSLKPSQRAALEAAAREWARTGVDAPERLAGQVDQALQRILTPAQQREFRQMLEAPSFEEGYDATSCFLRSKVGLILSMVAMMDCESTLASTAATDAWLASAYSSSCYMQGAEACEKASTSAAAAYTAWYELTGTCNLAAASALLEGMTYVSCGGTF